MGEMRKILQSLDLTTRESSNWLIRSNAQKFQKLDQVATSWVTLGV